MKNNFKTYAKKSVSLFLAVLMVMSCWVWMAPEEAKKAEAAEITPVTGYTVKITYSISNAGDGGHVEIDSVTNNGTGSSTGYTTVITSSNMNNGSDTVTVSGWPKKIRITTRTSATSTTKIAVTGIYINDFQVLSGSYTIADRTTLFSAKTDTKEFYVTNDEGTNGYANGATYTGSYFNWPKPWIVGFVNSTAEGTEQTMALNKIGGAEVNKNTTFTYGTMYDCYGVKWTGTNSISGLTETSHISQTPAGEECDNTDVYYDSTRGVVAKPNLQISDPKGSDGTAEYYLVKTYKGKDVAGVDVESKVSAKYTITYPKYDVKFNAVLGTAKITADKDYTQEYTPSNYHGGTITLPSKTEAAGYVFYDYWSKPQPTSGDASYNALTSKFAQPCSTEDYAAYKALEGSKEENNIVTDADGNRWYDAGKKLDPTTAKTIDVSENYANYVENWYGWWLAEDLSVKFYDVDGAFLGEKPVKAGQTQSAITWPTSSYSTYTSGAFTFTVDPSIWVTTDGTEINKNSYTFTKNLILTPKLTQEDFKDKYAIDFINPNTGLSVAVGTEGGNYDYRANIKSRADEALGKIADTPSDVDGALDYSYELLGWSSVEPTTGKKYHVLLEDADFDVNGTAIGLNSDWVVRNEATYYAVYRRHTKTYVVNFNYKDATGADATRQLKVKYGANLVPPTEYVPYTYVTKGFGYTFNKWAYTTNDSDATLDYNATIPFTNEYISIEGAALDGSADLDPIDITATYGAPVATPYTVTFNYVDDEGEDVVKNVEVKNEQFILQGTVDLLKPAEKWDHEDYLYTYADSWEITEGSATVGVDGAEKKVGDTIATNELTSLTPTSNLTFKAVYINPIPFYTVTYIDGDKTYTDRVLQDSNVPAWTEKVTNDNGTPDDSSDDFEEDKIYVPADYEGEGGMYEFQGWFDKETGGNKITTADKVTGNLVLYSQFKFIPDTFEIKFMSYDGKVQLGAGKYEKGQNIEALVVTATKAAQGRSADDTYTYLFLGWDKPVPTFCEGYDVTFIAQYKPVYKYYDVKWYNSKLVDEEWVAEKTDEANLLATTHHTYNSKLYAPAVDNLTCLETAPDGQNYVFAGWYYNDAEGNAHKYERGMIVTAEMEFYATYTLTAKVHTVTTVVRDEETKYSVADGEKANIPEPQAGYVDADKHDEFAGWYTDAACTTEFDAETVITEDIKIYAKFEQSEHERTLKELVTAPTYYAVGAEEIWCECNRENTKLTNDIPVLTDTKVPTGTIYLGGLGKWSSTDEIGGAALDNGVIDIYANANTDVIVTANDTGDVNDLYNPSGIGMGVKVIRAFIYPGKFETLTADSYGAAQSLTVDVYNDDTEALTNNANFAVKLGDFVVADLDEDGKPQYDENGKVKYKSLESGESYIIYYYVVDKAGNQLNRKVRTAKFIYDNTDPVFTIDGESNNAAVPTYCGVATVEGLEKGVVLTVNGTPVEVKYEDGAETGTYEIEYAEGVDNVIITATDKAGNTYSKKIKVAEHSYLLTKQEASCGVAGYEREVCIICGDVKTDKTSPALDHIWSGREVIPADCVNNGIVVVTCEICGDEVRTEFAEDGTPAIPALGHAFEKDENGEIVYTTVTASTCKTNGLAEAYCTACNGELKDGYITKELDLNPENHEDVTVTEVAADCINNGYYTKACSCGVTLEHKDHITDPDIYAAKGHGETVWEVIKEANCYQAGTMVGKCAVCTTIVVEETAYGYAETADGDFAYVLDEDGNKVEVDGKFQYYLVPATGEHIKTVANPDTYKTEGVVKYKCAEDGCPHQYEDKVLEDETLEEYTVKFLAEDGKTVIHEEKVVEGTYLKKDAATAPEKADTVEYDYTFAGWAVDGKTVKFPYEVTKDVTFTATYKETRIKYTHKFYVPTTITVTLADGDSDKTLYATLVGTYGDERVPSGTPVFTHKDPVEDARLKKLYTFEFKGWENTSGVIVKDFTVAGDTEFTAVFEAKAIKYKVTYYNGTDFVWQTEVDGGESVTYNKVDDEGNIINPEKAFDDTYHYAFEAWYTDATLQTKYTGGAITADTRLYAKFTATEHSGYVVNTKVGEAVDEANPEVKNGIVQEADCLLPELTEYICACGHTKKVETKAALGHDMGEYAYDEESGKMVAECSRCDYTNSYDASVTINFVDENGLSLYIVTVQMDANGTVEYEGKTPSKAADKENTYAFAGFKGEDGTVYAIDAKFPTDADATYTAIYTATARTYVVKYVDNRNNNTVVQEFTDLKYGDAVPAFTGDTKVLVIPAYTTYEHYVFDKWNVAEDATVTGDMYITPKFKAVEHNLVEGERVDATCTVKGGIEYKCPDCGYSYVDTDANLPAIGHAWDEGVVTLEPDYATQTDGIRTYTCKNGCGTTKTEPISGKSRSIKVTVKDENGTAIEHATVRLLKDGEIVKVQTTDNNGVTIFTGLDNGNYSIFVVDTNTAYNDIVVNEDGSVKNGDVVAEPEKEEVDTSCKCTCHKNTFWGIIFRFFQKIIKLFTGKPTCCACPDSRI